MLNTLNINLKTDIKTDRPTTLPIKLMSQDKNNNQFILRFTNGGESVTLDDTYTVEILTKFTKSGTSRLTSATVRQDYATWEFDTAYITQDETVYNYVYVRKSGSLVVSADANCFVFSVDLSEIDKGAGKVAETYDENYEKVLADYSGALDERTTERLDEAVADFNQRGGGLLDTVEANELDRVTKETARQTNESERLSAEATRKTAETDRVSSETTRKANETTRISNENARKSAEVIRLASEVDRVNAEIVRSEFYEGFDGRLDDLEANKVVLKNLVTNGDFNDGLNGWGNYGSAHVNSIRTVTEDPVSSSGYCLKVYRDNDQTGGFGVRRPFSFDKNSKLYVKVGMLRLSTDGSTSDLPLFTTENPLASNVGRNDIYDTWQHVSNVLDKTRLDVPLHLNLAPHNSGGGVTTYYDNIILIDLTEAFGVGNEPTKTEMDELIKITGYFDEITLTEMQLLNWQLKLMRQNRNALIALGGTII